MLDLWLLQLWHLLLLLLRCALCLAVAWSTSAAEHATQEVVHPATALDRIVKRAD